MKIISWNVNGINSKYKNGNLEELIQEQNPDILCIQEIRTKNVPELEGYEVYSYPSQNNSKYYGTAIYTKIKPISVEKGFDDEEFDGEGRVIKFEFESFNLYNVYSPSGAGSKDKLNRKYRFFDEFTDYFKKSEKPVVICGDFNRMAGEIDAKRPELMKNKSGFMPQEQEWFRKILSEYLDAFREFHPEGDNYSWWKNKELKAENKGIRLDYFLISKTLANTINDCYILPDQTEYDHAPIVLDISYCPVCGFLNKSGNEFCNQCGIKLSVGDDEEDIVNNDKLEIPKDKIILLDLNYTLIANSKEIWNYPLEKKIKSQLYEDDLIELIKDNYVILITASPYKRSHKILRDIKEKTGFVPDESYWNFGGQPPQVKKYWMENEILPQHGDNLDKYLAIESNPATRRMYKKLGIEARPKGDFI